MTDGTGTWTLNNNFGNLNTTTIRAGALSVASLANGGSNSPIGKSSSAAGNLVFAGNGTLGTLFTSTTDRSFTITDGVTAGFDVASGQTVTISGNTVNQTGGTSTGGLTKLNTGSLVLSGSLAYSGATTVNGGTLKLDFSGTSAPATNMISGTGALSLGGGTLTLARKASAANSQTFSSLALASGPSTITLSQGTATSLTAVLGAITPATGATLNFSVAPTTSGVIATTANSNDASGILGTWATVSSGTTLKYATQTGVSNQIGAYSGGTPAATGANLTDTTGLVNYDLAVATGTAAAGFSANTIRYTGGALTTTGSTGFSVNGLMNAGTGTWAINGTALTIGGNKELAIINNTQRITINSAIQDNAGGASALTFTGAGSASILALYGVTTYSGPTSINNGTVYIQALTGLGSSNQIYLNGGTLNPSVTMDLGSSRTINVGSNGAWPGMAGSTGGFAARAVDGSAWTGMAANTGGFAGRAVRGGALTGMAGNTGGFAGRAVGGGVLPQQDALPASGGAAAERGKKTP